MPHLPEYPTVPGNKVHSVFTIAGLPAPGGYVAVVPGSPPTGGQTVTAQDLGMVEIEHVVASGSDDGTYLVNVIYPNNPTRAVRSIILQWLTAAGGAEVVAGTVLSARTVRLHVWGR